MNLTPLSAISPVDGRYREKCAELAGYFSESALMRYRVYIEILYFIALCRRRLPQLKNTDRKIVKSLKNIYLDFDENDLLQIKEIERTTNHDVKAVEYFLKIKFNEYGLENVKEFVHFGLTSQDINNTAVPLSIKNCLNEVYFPAAENIIGKLKQLTMEWAEITMLAHTHGQPASPTKLGKEMAVFYERLNQQLQQLKAIPVSAKFGGATGNFNAHAAAYPNIDWNAFADKFVSSLGLQRLQVTTQIEHYDNLAALCDGMKRINTILIDLCRDAWTYISMNYFEQGTKKGEVGSSVMPHKINPIDFENAEGNFGMANAVLAHLSAKLPVSRLQRDLTDSTVLRNIGVPFAHTLIAMKSLMRGLRKVKVNRVAIDSDLEDNWAVVTEAIQTILRREGFADPYETLKDLTRKNKKITKKQIAVFIEKLDVSNKVKKELHAITPFNYTGIFKMPG